MLMMKMFLIRIEFVWALVLAWCIVTSASAMDDIATKPGATGKPNEAVELVLTPFQAGLRLDRKRRFPFLHPTTRHLLM